MKIQGKSTHLERGFYSLIALLLFFAVGCGSSGELNVFQKEAPIPESEWDSTYRPEFAVNIEDTLARYDLYLTLRHTNRYPFSNLWILIRAGREGKKEEDKRVELPLADKSGKWFGTGLSDIYEHKILLRENTKFDTAGVYHFSLTHNMRLNPLPYIMSVGLRVEKKTF